MMTHPFFSYCATAVLLLMCYGLFGQALTQDPGTSPAQTSNQERKHRLFTEVGGRTLVFGSLNYEYALSKNLSLGCGLGFIGFRKGAISRVTHGDQETGNYRETATSQLVFANYLVGSERHKLLLTAGLTNFLQTSRSRYPSGTVSSVDSQVEWNAGIGYQLELDKMYFRLTGYCLSMPDPTGWFPKYIPWAGISVGLKL
jgi:hypothetical protein